MGSARRGPRRPRAGKQGGAVLSPCVPAHPGDPLTHTLTLATRRPELPCQGSGSPLCETHPQSPGLAGQCQFPQTQGNPSHCPHVISLSLLNPLGPSEQRPLPLASASPAHLLSLGGHPHPSGREGLGPPAFYHRARTMSHGRKNQPTAQRPRRKKQNHPSSRRDATQFSTWANLKSLWRSYQNSCGFSKVTGYRSVLTNASNKEFRTKEVLYVT